jgi:hypothetical protein
METIQQHLGRASLFKAVWLLTAFIIWSCHSETNSPPPPTPTNCPEAWDEASELLDSVEAYWTETYLLNCFSMGDTAVRSLPMVVHALDVKSSKSQPFYFGGSYKDMTVCYDGVIPLNAPSFSTGKLLPGVVTRFGITEKEGTEIYENFYLCDSMRYASLRAHSFLTFSFMYREDEESAYYPVHKRIKQSEGYVYFPAGELPEHSDSSYLIPGPKLSPKTYRELLRIHQ